MQAEITNGNVRVQQTFHQAGEILLIEIAESLLFGSEPNDRVSAAGIEIIRQTAAVLKSLPPSQILIEGHTRKGRIKDKSNGHFSSVVELSKARTLAVLGYLQEFGLDPHNLSASWHIETRPLTLIRKREENRAKSHSHFNIIVLPQGMTEFPSSLKNLP